MSVLLLLKSLGVVLLSVLNVLSNIVVFLIAVPQLKKLWVKLKHWFELNFIYRKKDQNWEGVKDTDEILMIDTLVGYSALTKNISSEIYPYVPYIPVKTVIDICFKILKEEQKKVEDYKTFILKLHNKDIAYAKANEDQSKRVFDIFLRSDRKKFDWIIKVFTDLKGFGGAILKDWDFHFENLLSKLDEREQHIIERRDIFNELKKRLNL